jgi:acetylornithine aminotransferase
MTAPDAWRDRFSAAMMRTFAPPVAMLERGEGCYVWDVDGKRYLDFLAGIAVNVSNYFASPPQLELAERLRRITGAGEAGRVFFCNSGAESIEAAIKLARLNRGDGRRRRIISLVNSFHGRTMGSLSLTGKAALREDFEPLLPGVEHIASTIEALEKCMDDTVAAIFIEPIKGEAGVLDLPDGGRSGTWFSFQQFGIVPDALCLAKGIAGGVPIGALVTFGAASELFRAGQHGSTFGGNPLATAAGNAVLGEIERAGLIENARVRGGQLRRLIADIGSPLVGEIRGQGILVGVGLTQPVANDVAAKAFELGLIVNAPNDSSIRIAPPLIVGEAELAEFATLFASALEASA